MMHIQKAIPSVHSHSKGWPRHWPSTDRVPYLMQCFVKKKKKMLVAHWLSQNAWFCSRRYIWVSKGVFGCLLGEAMLFMLALVSQTNVAELNHK